MHIYFNNIIVAQIKLFFQIPKIFFYYLRSILWAAMIQYLCIFFFKIYDYLPSLKFEQVTEEKILIIFLDSERSDECIDFTMMCVVFFCVSVYSITSRNNAPISNFGGGFRCKSEYPWCIIKVKSKHFSTVFKKIEINKKNNDRKTGIFT
ncbi:Uncharacterized protein FWK35_00031111 [Aphis craccivora]|uniref:Uncharacterized protein n=1 Tax=Aphis craccivora TaxID=307492 RepID=A0A6G0W2D2_APHCR|nr:Uncharacterized protein FWK35_00031111 [Aphis craccivora]